MIFVYIRIYYAAKARANKGLTKEKKNHRRRDGGCSPTETGGSSVMATPNVISRTHPTIASTATVEHHRNVPNEQSVLINKKVQICDVRVHNDFETETVQNIPVPDTAEECTPLRTLSASVDADHRNHNFKDENGLYLSHLKPNQHDLRIARTSPTLSPTKDCPITASPSGTLRRDHSVPSVDGDQMSDMDPSSSDSGAISRCSVMKPLKMRFCHPLIGKKINKPKREMIDMGRVSTPKALRDPEKEKKRIARKKEKRATLILGLIMGSFIACWLPFFIMYILGPITSFPVIAFDVAFWLGYMNSAFNPVIYTIFNKDFRRAFRKILFK